MDPKIRLLLLDLDKRCCDDSHEQERSRGIEHLVVGQHLRLQYYKGCDLLIDRRVFCVYHGISRDAHHVVFGRVFEYRRKQGYSERAGDVPCQGKQGGCHTHV